jgi:hypothetical protein
LRDADGSLPQLLRAGCSRWVVQPAVVAKGCFRQLQRTGIRGQEQPLGAGSFAAGCRVLSRAFGSDPCGAARASTSARPRGATSVARLARPFLPLQDLGNDLPTVVEVDQSQQIHEVPGLDRVAQHSGQALAECGESPCQRTAQRRVVGRRRRATAGLGRPS